MGAQGRVLGLERSEAYVASGRHMAKQAGLHQLELRLQDLLSDPWPEESFDLIWCRWVAMFLPKLSPPLLEWTNASHRAVVGSAIKTFTGTPSGCIPTGGRFSGLARPVKRVFVRTGPIPT